MQDRTATQRLADEIYHVYLEIRKIIPDVHRRIGRADPTWIFLEPEKSDSTEKQATMRDYVLYQYATAERSSNPSISTIKQQAIACPLSFDVTSNPKIYDIDHFHPQATMMAKLEKLEETDQSLLQGVREELEKKLKNEIQKKPIPKKKEREIQAVLNSLMPSENGQIKVTGLKNLYYNYPGNLWPLSGPVNSRKQARSPLAYASETTFSVLHTYAGAEDFDLLVHNIEKELVVNHEEIISTSQKELFLSRRLAEGFMNGATEEPFILPHRMEASSVIGELNFFKGTILGQTAENYCQATAELTVRSMQITRNCLKHTPQSRAGVSAVYKCLNHAVSGDNNSVSTGPELSLPALSTMDATIDNLQHLKAKNQKKFGTSTSLSDTTHNSASSSEDNLVRRKRKSELIAEESKITCTKTTQDMRQKLNNGRSNSKATKEEEDPDQPEIKRSKKNSRR